MMRHGSQLVIGGQIILSGYVMSDEHAGWAWEDEVYFCPAMVRQALETLGDTPAVVRLNSVGGDPVAGEAIRSILALHPGGVRIVVEGAASSAASLLLMGGQRREMTAGSWIMIHNPSAFMVGDADAMRGAADMLDMLGRIYGQVYAQASGQDLAAVLQMMAAETYMSAEEAISAGFAHAISDETLAGADAATAQIAGQPPVAQALTDAARQTMRGALATWSAMMRAGPRSVAPGAQTPAASRGALAPAAVQMETNLEPLIPTPAPGQNPANPAAAAVTPALQMAAPAAPAAPAAQEAALAERRRIGDIRTMAAPFMAAGRLTEADVQALIDDGTAAAMAGNRLIATMAAREPAGSSTAPAARGRDETETRRLAMEDALVTRLSPARLEDQTRTAAARQYMDFSLVEMAAGRLGQARIPGQFAAREEILRMAFQSTSDFPALFENALNRSLAARYALAQPTYRRIARQRTYADFRDHTSVRVGDFPELQEVSPQGGEVKAGTFGESKETTRVTAYGVAVAFSRQALVNDSLNGIDQVLNDRGAAVARFEERKFYEMMLGGSNADGPTLLETTRQVFNTTDSTKAGTAAAISVAAMGIATEKLMSRTSKDGAKLGLFPSILLTGPAKWLEAQQLVASVTAQQAGNVNPFSGIITPISCAWITGNAWYVFADPGAAACFEWGLLDGYTAPRFRMDEPFGRQGVSFSLEHDFGCGAIDFRGGFKNAGA